MSANGTFRSATRLMSACCLGRQVLAPEGGNELDALGGVRHPEHRPRVGRVALLVQPREVVVARPRRSRSPPPRPGWGRRRAAEPCCLELPLDGINDVVGADDLLNGSSEHPDSNMLHLTLDGYGYRWLPIRRNGQRLSP
jgi:hypothetical protein